MTLAEIQREVVALSESDRVALKAFLLHLGRVNDPENRRDLGERMRSIEAGNKVSLDDFIRLNASVD